MLKKISGKLIIITIAIVILSVMLWIANLVLTNESQIITYLSENPNYMQKAQNISEDNYTLSSDYTSSIQLLGNIAPNKGAFARNVWVMQEFNGKIYAGHGNSSNNISPANAGPIPVIAIDPLTNRLRTEYTINGEQIWRYNIIKDKLYIPDDDSKEGWSWGNLYINTPNSGWIKKRTIPGGVHVYDIVEYDNKLWVAMSSASSVSGGMKPLIQYSKDGGDTWEMEAGRLVTSSYRMFTLLTSGDSLFGITTARYSSGRLTINGCKITANGETLNIPTNVSSLSNISITGTELVNNRSYIIKDKFNFNGKLVFSMQGLGTNTNNYASYIEPGGVYYSTSFPTDMTRINLPDSNAKAISAFAKDGSVYILAHIENSPTSYTNIVYKTTNLITVTEILRFDYGSFAFSFEKLTGQDEFFFGIGAKDVSPSSLSGNILRISLRGEVLPNPNNSNADLSYLYYSRSYSQYNNPLTGESETFTSEAQQLSPAFSSDNTEYSLTVPYHFTRINLVGQVVATGAKAPSSSNDDLKIGINPVSITVTAPDGVTKKTYTVNVIRENPLTTSTLSALSVTSTNGNTTYSLSPAYSSSTYFYEVKVPSNVSSVNISARSSSSKYTAVSSLDIDNMTRAYENSNVTTSGTITGLVAGVPKLVRIVVTSQSGAIRIYNIMITREGTSPVTSLSVISNLLPEGKRGSLYEARGIANGGTGPYTWTATGLPTGLVIDSSTGRIRGTITANSGTYNVELTAKDSTGATAKRTVQLVVTSPIASLFINTLWLPASTIGTDYSATVTSSGGASSLTWSATELPNGLTLGSSNGIISGTPTVSGTYNVVLTVKDSIGATATKTLTLTVNGTDSSKTIEEIFSSTYTIETSAGINYITYIKEETTVQTIRQQLNLPAIYTLEIINMSGQTLTNTGYAGTGSTIIVKNQASQILKEYKIVVKGDITADGTVNLFDITTLIQYVFNPKENFSWDESVKRAGKTTSTSGNPSLFDIQRLINYCYNDIQW